MATQKVVLSNRTSLLVKRLAKEEGVSVNRVLRQAVTLLRSYNRAYAEGHRVAILASDDGLRGQLQVD